MVSKKQLTLGLKYDNSLSKIAKKNFPQSPSCSFITNCFDGNKHIFISLPYSIFAKLEQIIVIFKRFPRIKYYNNIHNNHISLVIKRQLKQKYIIKVSKKLLP